MTFSSASVRLAWAFSYCFWASAFASARLSCNFRMLSSSSEVSRVQMTSPSSTESPTCTFTVFTVYFRSVVTLDTSLLCTVPVALMESSRVPFCRVTVRT